MGFYELEVKSENNIIYQADGKTEVYTLEKEPDAGSSLVQESRKSILQTIQLDELFRNLDNCVSLLDITYNAVNGMGMSASVAGLKDKFSNTLNKSLVTMSGFEAGTRTSVSDFIKSYEYLTNPVYINADKNGVTMAVEKLSVIENRAVNMEKQSADLADTLDKIEAFAQDITRQIMEERDADVEAKNKALAKLNQLQGKVDALKQVKETLDEEIEDYGSQYNKLSAQIEKNEKRSYSLALVSAIMGGLSTMFGGNGISGAQQGQNPQPGSGDGKISDDRAKKDYEESQRKVRELQDKISEYDRELNEIKEKLQSETDEATRKELSDRQDQLTIDKKQTESELETARGQAEVYEKTLDGLSGGLSKTSEALNNMAEKLDDKNMSQYERLDKIAHQKSEVQEERRKTILQLSEMTAEIENATTESRDLDVCITALITAVGCMRIVKVYLSDIAIFWKNVARFCNLLSEQIKGLNEEIVNFKNLENYCEIFRQNSFIQAYLLNIVSWTALNIVSREYLDAFNKTRGKYQELEKMGEDMPQEHWKRAKEAAKALNVNLKKELE